MYYVINATTLTNILTMLKTYTCLHYLNFICHTFKYDYKTNISTEGYSKDQLKGKGKKDSTLVCGICQICHQVH